MKRDLEAGEGESSVGGKAVPAREGRPGQREERLGRGRHGRRSGRGISQWAERLRLGGRS